MSALAERIEDVSPEPGRVVAKAAFNAAQELGLSQRDLAQAIGVSEATVSRMKGGGYALQGKPFELATCVIRIFRSLDAIAGADPDTIRGWMAGENRDLNGIPRIMMAQATGLVTVMNYLDAARAPT
ncbi:antitoxin Xre-like helix-turn-helix domain-containing protein [uncultured Roseovarius sp.]|uniref:antitoxin Xre-like helix-turn-helix domain-containing protein n=1 Tax=uncultured Roseovarius sp. TaxID=293344 RepID=UPI0026353DD9|nr:antitoxin Xre-like helix-turn-helix domain-containing protein [uncultured Roseovarius sp.]